MRKKEKQKRKEKKRETLREGLIEVHVDFGRHLKAIFRDSFALVGGHLCVERARREPYAGVSVACTEATLQSPALPVALKHAARRACNECRTNRRSTSSHLCQTPSNYALKLHSTHSFRERKTRRWLVPY